MDRLTRKEFGYAAENLVAQYLIAQGFSIRAHNYICRGGEIDIIAAKDDLLVFVEVKMRAQFFTYSHEVISTTKQRFCIFAAKTYLARHAITDKICRFDVALVVNPSEPESITYVADAFQEHTY